MKQAWVAMVGLLVALGGARAMGEVPLWGVVELSFGAQEDHAAPLWDVNASVTATGPGNQTQTVDLFWDGGRTWRARLSPNVPGVWNWKTSAEGDAGLDGQQGEFTCAAADAPGPLRLSDDRRSLCRAGSTPFFWLGDTAWNGALRAKPEDWETYLAARAKQGFNVIQLVTTQWRGWNNLMPVKAFIDGDRLAVNPEVFQQIDRAVAAVNRHGLVAAPVLLWALWPSDPGQALSIPNAVRLARYTVARLGAYDVVWFLGGDGKYEGERAERWRTIGRAVFDGQGTGRLATIHPCGQSWVGDEFGKEPWFDFVGYQSSHGGGESTQKFIVSQQAATTWRDEPHRPILNLEPLYEGYDAKLGGAKRSYEVRRAAWWSMLSSPMAGVSYGNGPIWVWNDQPAEPEGHERLGKTAPWSAGVESSGIRSVALLKRVCEGLPWWTLRPAQELLGSQPGAEDVFQWQSVAADEARRIVLAYLPNAGRIELQGLDDLKGEWIDPDGGERVPAQPGAVRTAPAWQDAVLLLRR